MKTLIYAFFSILLLCPPRIEALTIPRKQSESELTVLGITLGKSTMEEVKKKFGAKEIYQEDEGKDMNYVLCFKGPGNMIVAFQSDSLGGPDHLVNSILLSGPAAHLDFARLCQKTTLIKDRPSIAGLTLGMSPDLIKARLGRPSSMNNNTSMAYQFLVQEKTEKGEKDVSSSLDIFFQQSAAVQIRAYKLESISF